MTNEDFADHLQVAPRTVAYWRQQPQMVPRQGMQQILDIALEQASELARAQFRRILAESGAAPSALAGAAVPDDPSALAEWLTATSTSDEAIEGIDRAASVLAESHARTPPQCCCQMCACSTRASCCYLPRGGCGTGRNASYCASMVTCWRT